MYFLKFYLFERKSERKSMSRMRGSERNRLPAEEGV